MRACTCTTLVEIRGPPSGVSSFLPYVGSSEGTRDIGLDDKLTESYSFHSGSQHQKVCVATLTFLCFVFVVVVLSLFSQDRVLSYLSGDTVLAMWLRQPLNSQWSSCIALLSARITDANSHRWLPAAFKELVN